MSAADEYASAVLSDANTTILTSLGLGQKLGERRIVMRLSARNKLKGKILEVRKGAKTTHVKIDIGGAVVTASITNEAAEELKLAAGEAAYAQRMALG
jgi:molybdopterin-binding protein